MKDDGKDDGKDNGKDGGDATANDIYIPPRKRQEANREQEIIRGKLEKDAKKSTTASSSERKPPHEASQAVDMSSSYYGVEEQFVRSTSTINKMRHTATMGNPAAMRNRAVIHNSAMMGNSAAMRSMEVMHYPTAMGRTSRTMSASQRGGLPYDNHCTYCQMLGLPEEIYKSHEWVLLLRDDQRVNCNRYLDKGCGLCSGEYKGVHHHIEIHCIKWENTNDPGFYEFARNFNIEKWEADQKRRKTGEKKREPVPMAPSAPARPVPRIIKNSNQVTWIRGRAPSSSKK